MKFKSMIVLAVFMLFGCASTGGDGASSPKKVFQKIKKIGRENLTEYIHLIAPSDRALTALSLDLSAAMAMALFPGGDMAREYDSIRVKYGLPPAQEMSGALILDDSASLIQYAGRHYQNIEHQGFVSDMKAFLERVSGPAKKDYPAWMKLKAVVVEGNTARASVLLVNGSLEPVEFVSVNNRWYLKLQPKEVLP